MEQRLRIVVVAKPHELLGHVPKAIFEPAANVAADALAAETIAWLSTKLSAAKLPRGIEYANALPRDPNDKLYRRRLV